MKGSNDSEIEGVSLNNTYGFDVTHHNVNEAKTLHVVISFDLLIMVLFGLNNLKKENFSRSSRFILR